jgi:sulfonate transport system substrate-binding protein
MLVKDLKGKRVATGIGSTSHFSLLTALENEGLSERDITLVGMEVSDMPQALASGAIDAFSAWEPTPTLAFAGHPGFHLVHKGLSFGFLCFRRDFVAAHPQETRLIAAAVERSSRWMRLPGNIEQVARWTVEGATRLQGKLSSLTESQIAHIVRADLLNVPAAPQIPGRLLQERELLWKEFQFLKRVGAIPGDIPWEKVRNSFDVEPMRGVLSDDRAFQLESFEFRTGSGQGGAK